MAVTTEKNGPKVDRIDQELSNPADYAPNPVRSTGGSYFSVYKKGQGYWTRMGTALAAAMIIIVTMAFAYKQGALFAEQKRWIPVAVAATVGAIVAVFAWVLMNKPRNVDFLIATDVEMKKVNWTSREELLGSTKIVIFFMFFIASVLFLIDVVVTGFFQLIGLLKFGLFG